MIRLAAAITGIALLGVTTARWCTQDESGVRAGTGGQG